jgi:hypothetical protein
MKTGKGWKLRAKETFARILLKSELGGKIVHSKQLWAYLEESGWFKSRASGVPVGGDGESIPWLTYPAIRFLDRRITREMHVFEFGSGSSTRWWSRRVARIVSCEHDVGWFEKTQGSLPSSVEYLFRELNDGHAYPDAVLGYSDEFHVVVIDGRHRAACARNALAALRSDGVLIWDDTHRERYREGCSYIESQRFSRLDFEGLSPLSARPGCTSVFYRRSNCLKL